MAGNYSGPVGAYPVGSFAVAADSQQYVLWNIFRASLYVPTAEAVEPSPWAPYPPVSIAFFPAGSQMYSQTFSFAANSDTVSLIKQIDPIRSFTTTANNNFLQRAEGIIRQFGVVANNNYIQKATSLVAYIFGAKANNQIQKTVDPIRNFTAVANNNFLQRANALVPYVFNVTANNNYVQKGSTLIPYVFGIIANNSSIHKTVDPTRNFTATANNNFLQRAITKTVGTFTATANNLIQKAVTKVPFLSTITKSVQSVASKAYLRTFTGSITANNNFLQRANSLVPYVFNVTANNNFIQKATTLVPYVFKITANNNFIQKATTLIPYVFNVTANNNFIQKATSLVPYVFNATANNNSIQKATSLVAYVFKATANNNLIQKAVTKVPFLSTITTGVQSTVSKAYLRAFSSAIMAAINPSGVPKTIGKIIDPPIFFTVQMGSKAISKNPIFNTLTSVTSAAGKSYIRAYNFAISCGALVTPTIERLSHLIRAALYVPSAESSVDFWQGGPRAYPMTYIYKTYIVNVTSTITTALRSFVLGGHSAVIRAILYFPGPDFPSDVWVPFHRGYSSIAGHAVSVISSITSTTKIQKSLTKNILAIASFTSGTMYNYLYLFAGGGPLDNVIVQKAVSRTLTISATASSLFHKSYAVLKQITLFAFSQFMAQVGVITIIRTATAIARVPFNQRQIAEIVKSTIVTAVSTTKHVTKTAINFLVKTATTSFALSSRTPIIRAILNFPRPDTFGDMWVNIPRMNVSLFKLPLHAVSVIAHVTSINKIQKSVGKAISAIIIFAQNLGSNYNPFYLFSAGGGGLGVQESQVYITKQVTKAMSSIVNTLTTALVQRVAGIQTFMFTLTTNTKTLKIIGKNTTSIVHETLTLLPKTIGKNMMSLVSFAQGSAYNSYYLFTGMLPYITGISITKKIIKSTFDMGVATTTILATPYDKVIQFFVSLVKYLAWQSNTLYPAFSTVQGSDGVYVTFTSGTSSVSGDPSGLNQNGFTDGTLRWGPMVGGWQANTIFGPYAVIYWNGLYYSPNGLSGGTTSNTGGPSGTSPFIDGAITWYNIIPLQLQQVQLTKAVSRTFTGLITSTNKILRGINKLLHPIVSTFVSITASIPIFDFAADFTITTTAIAIKQANKIFNSKITALIPSVLKQAGKNILFAMSTYPVSIFIDVLGQIVNLAFSITVSAKILKTPGKNIREIVTVTVPSLLRQLTKYINILAQATNLSFKTAIPAARSAIVDTSVKLSKTPGKVTNALITTTVLIQRQITNILNFIVYSQIPPWQPSVFYPLEYMVQGTDGIYIVITAGTSSPNIGAPSGLSQYGFSGGGTLFFGPLVTAGWLPNTFYGPFAVIYSNGLYYSPNGILGNSGTTGNGPGPSGTAPFADGSLTWINIIPTGFGQVLAIKSVNYVLNIVATTMAQVMKQMVKRALNAVITTSVKFNESYAYLASMTITMTAKIVKNIPKTFSSSLEALVNTFTKMPLKNVSSIIDTTVTLFFGGAIIKSLSFVINETATIVKKVQRIPILFSVQDSLSMTKMINLARIFNSSIRETINKIVSIGRKFTVALKLNSMAGAFKTISRLSTVTTKVYIQKISGQLFNMTLSVLTNIPPRMISLRRTIIVTSHTRFVYGYQYFVRVISLVGSKVYSIATLEINIPVITARVERIQNVINAIPQTMANTINARILNPIQKIIARIIK